MMSPRQFCNAEPPGVEPDDQEPVRLKERPPAGRALAVLVGSEDAEPKKAPQPQGIATLPDAVICYNCATSFEETQMERTATRSARLFRLQQLLHYALGGMTVKQLADQLGVSLRTIQRDLITLQCDMGVPLTQDGRRYGIVGTYILPPVTFSLHEARVLLIAARLFLRYSDETDPHGISALERLTRALPLPVAEQMQRCTAALRAKPPSKQFIKVLESVTEAWARQRLLRIRYYSRARPLPHEALVEPYLLEASAPGYSTYLIGYSRTHGEVRTFKIERIEQAEMLDEVFQRRADARLEDAIANSWGIVWADDEEREEIHLKFSPAVASRVREATWHPSQRVYSSRDGSCSLTMTVPSLVEIVPWVRSWGPDVEVIGPKALRELIATEAMAIARLYGGAGDEAGGPCSPL